MIEQSFHSYLPFPLPRNRDSTVQRWAAAHQDLFSTYDNDIEQIRESYRITDATGTDLDEIGERFGRIGRRRGRGDEEYRQLLMSIDSAFAGRGTPQGVRFAVGAGVRADPDDEVTIYEHFDDLAYSLAIEDWIGHRVSTVHELADLADPSGVHLRKPVIYDSPAIDVGANADDTVSGTVVTSPDANAAASAGNTTTSIERAGAGAGRFDGLDEFGEGEQLGGGADSGEDSYGQASYSQFTYGESSADTASGPDPNYVESSETLSIDDTESIDVTSPMDVEGSVENQGEVSSTDDSSTQTTDSTDDDGEDSGS